MRRAPWILAGLLIAGPATGEEGLNLSWDDCGSHGASNKAFACDTNTGEDVLVLSFKLSDDLVGFLGSQGYVDVRGYPSLPDWWRFSEPPPGSFQGCRGLVLSMDTMAGACPTSFPNDVGGGYGIYRMDSQVLRIAIGSANDSDVKLLSRRRVRRVPTKDSSLEDCRGRILFRLHVVGMYRVQRARADS